MNFVGGSLRCSTFLHRPQSLQNKKNNNNSNFCECFALEIAYILICQFEIKHRVAWFSSGYANIEQELKIYSLRMTSSLSETEGKSGVGKSPTRFLVSCFYFIRCLTLCVKEPVKLCLLV